MCEPEFFGCECAHTNIKKQVGMVTANFVYFRATPPHPPVVRRPLLLLAVVIRHVHHCPCPCALVRPHPLALADLALALAPLSALACVPLAPRPLLPPSTTTAIAAINDHHCRCRTFNDNNRQKPAVVIRRSLAAMVVIVECGGGRWLRRQWRLCRRCRQRRLAPSAPSHRRLRQQ